MLQKDSFWSFGSYTPTEDFKRDNQHMVKVQAFSINLIEESPVHIIFHPVTSISAHIINKH